MKRIILVLIAALLVVIVLLAFVEGYRHRQRVQQRQAAVTQAAGDLTRDAREYSQAAAQSPASLDSLLRERPRAAQAVQHLRDVLGRDIEVSFEPAGASRSDWVSIAVSRRGVVLLETVRDGRVRMYNPKLPSRAMACHCIGAGN
jgi:hypothetical protein